MEIVKQNRIFFGRIARYYDRFFGNWIRKMQIRVINITQIRNKSRILDAGCGTGNLLTLLENYNVQLYGIDISKEMLKIASTKLKKTKLRLGSVEKLSFKDNHFDYIFSIDAFHHYSNKNNAMKNFNRVLKKNGKLIIVDVNFGRIFNKIFQKIEPGNNGIYTKPEMKNTFKQHGFKRIKQSNVGLFTILTSGIK